MTIKPSEYMVKVQGGRTYLPVAPRIVMFRDEHKDWQISTEILTFGDETLVKATICDNAGLVVATAHKTVTAFRGGAIEKAETGAIGRALSLCGFGTIQAGDMDEGEELADAPVTRDNGAKAPTHPPAPEMPVAQPTDATDAAPINVVAWRQHVLKTVPRYTSTFALRNVMTKLGLDEPTTREEGVRMAHLLSEYARRRDAGMDDDQALAEAIES